MKRKLALTAAIWGATVLLMALQKPIFLLYYASEAAAHSAAELWQVVWHGLKLDMTVAGYITALPILFLLASLWVKVPERWGRRLIGGYLTAVSVAVAILFAVDLGLYEYWGFRLDSTILIYLSDPKEAMASLDGWMIVRQTLIGAAYGAAMILLYRQVVRLYDDYKPSWRTAAGWSVVMLLLAGFDFLSIRGGVGTSVANVSKVCFSSKLFLNHAATNPIFSFLSTLGKQERYNDVYTFYDEAELAENFARVRGNNPTEGEPRKLLRTERPNVLIVVLESFGSTVFEAEVEGREVCSSMRALQNEAISFDRFYANSFRTDRGQMAILSGFPAQTKISLMKLTPKCQELPSIARSLGREGYTTAFYYGGDLNFTNQASYMYATGWQELIWQKSMHFDAPTSKWGYDDAVVGDFVADEVIRRSAEATPFLAGWLTLSSHEPFDVSEQFDFPRFEDPRTNAFSFTDGCVGHLVERLKGSAAWENLLVVLVADHGCRAFDTSQSRLDEQRIPMLWLGGAVAEPTRIDFYGSQIDLAATLLGQLGIAHDDFDYSKDMLHPATRNFAYYTYNEGFGIVDERGHSTWDAASGRTNDEADDEQLMWGRTLLQQTYLDIDRR